MRKIIAFILIPLIGILQAVRVHAQTGRASYYSDRLHGHRMSNGDRYHRDSMTCAHLKYPLGSYLRVKNLLNKKEVIVKVTDRGPFSKRFIIDLSRAAARKLDLLHRGFAQVEITPYYPQVVPYRADSAQVELPELNLEYTPVAVYPDPAWMDSVYSFPGTPADSLSVPSE